MLALIDTYVYLARRDKKGIKILTTFLSQSHIPERIRDITTIPLDAAVSQKIAQSIYDERLNWEPWIESASTYEEFKNRLKKRGYLGIPLSSQPLFYTENLVINTVINKKVMIQKTI